jgi:hypothetical protein
MAFPRKPAFAFVLLLACGKKSSPPPLAAASDAGPAATVAVADAAPSPPSTFSGTTSAEPRPKRADAGGCIAIPDEGLDGEELELVGKLTVDTQYTHPNGTLTRPYILKLDKPRCTDSPIGWEDGDEEAKSTIREVHVAPDARRLDLRPLKNAKVKVRGKYMVAHTAWHARPLVVFLTSAERIGPAPERAPLDPLRDGKHFGHIDKIDLGAMTMSFDVGQLYLGKAAIAEQKRRRTLGGIMAANEKGPVDPNETFWVDDEFDPRTIPIDPNVTVAANPVPANKRDGGVQPNVPLPLTTLADWDAGSPFFIDRGYEITIKDGKVVKIEEADRARY